MRKTLFFLALILVAVTCVTILNHSAYVASQEEIKILAPSDDKTFGDNGFIGALACKKCHEDMYKVWQEKGKHAKAIEDLEKDPKKEAKCYKCHKAGAPTSTGVDCETCHGPAFLHAKTSPKDLAKRDYAAGKILKPTEEKCKTCHNPESPNYKEFKFKEFYEKIQHKLPPPED